MNLIASSLCPLWITCCKNVRAIGSITLSACFPAITKSFSRTRSATEADSNQELNQDELQPISPKLPKKDLDAFIQRNVPSGPKLPNNTSENLSETKIHNSLPDETFDSFLKRQEKAAQQKNKDPPIPKQKSYISKSSSQLAARALKKLANDSANSSPTNSPKNDKKKSPKDKSYNFHVVQAQGMIKNIELTSIKLEMEADRMKECTFTPSTDLSRAQSEKILKEREARQKVNGPKKVKQNQEVEEEEVNKPTSVKQKTARKNPFPTLRNTTHRS